MMSSELIQLLQFLIIMVSIILISYCVVQSIKESFHFTFNETKSVTLSEVFEHIKSLTVSNYECFHKYQIWRIYRFS
jgi:hypothetical protein